MTQPGCRPRSTAPWVGWSWGGTRTDTHLLTLVSFQPPDAVHSLGREERGDPWREKASRLRIPPGFFPPKKQCWPISTGPSPPPPPQKSGTDLHTTWAWVADGSLGTRGALRREGEVCTVGQGTFGEGHPPTGSGLPVAPPGVGGQERGRARGGGDTWCVTWLPLVPGGPSFPGWPWGQKRGQGG